MRLKNSGRNSSIRSGINNPLSLANPLVTASISDTEGTVLLVLKYFILVIQISDSKVNNQGWNLSTFRLKNY
jgi:hypothetical protein